VNSGDTAWLLVSSALVFVMTAAGPRALYGGLVRRKNMLSVLMQCMMISSWSASSGWSSDTVSRSPDHGGIIGGLDWVGLRGFAHHAALERRARRELRPTVPHLAFAIFQMISRSSRRR